MAYSTTADLQNAVEAAILVELTSDTGTVTLDEDKIDRAIADADAIIDGYLSRRYTTPLVTVPALIRKVSVDLALFNLFKRRAAHFDIPAWLQISFDSAMATLKAINKADIDLGITAPAASSDEIAQVSEGSERLFTNETLEDF